LIPSCLVVVVLWVGCAGPQGLERGIDLPDSLPGIGSACVIEETGFAERAELLMRQVADHYEPTVYADRGKYSFPKAIARFELYGLDDAQGNGYVEEYADGRYAFFHFPFVGMARLLAGYGGAPSLMAHRHEYLDRILNHAPNDAYNALTSEGTENHIGMSRTSGYIFAMEARAEPGLEARAAQWHEELDTWIRAWGSRIYRYGTGEWDSSVYTAYNLIGWLNVYDFSEDPEVRAVARAVLDYYATAIALKYSAGIYGGAEARGTTRYGPGPMTATEYLGWLWFGDAASAAAPGFWSGNDYIQSVHAATSAYRPPTIAAEIASKALRPATYHNTKPDYRLMQRGQHHEVFHIGETFTLGSVQSPLGGWTNASYGLVNWKMVIDIPRDDPVVVWGNGGMKSSAHARGRNPFDQFFQYRGTLVQMTRVPEDAEQIAADVAARVREWQQRHDADFRARWNKPHMNYPGPVLDTATGDLAQAHLSHVFVPEGATLHPIAPDNSALCFVHGSTVVALHTLSGRAPRITSGRLTDAPVADGALAGFVVEAVAAGPDTSVADVMAGFAGRTRIERSESDPLWIRYVNFEGDSIEVRYNESGAWTEMDYDLGYGVTERRVSMNTDDWEFPEWPSGRGHGRIPIAAVNGTAVEYDADAPIYDGPQILLDEAVLRLSSADGEHHFEVDFRSALPSFSCDDVDHVQPRGL